MVWVFSALAVVVWLLGLASGYTFSGKIHLLLVLAFVIALVGRIRRSHPT